MASIVTVDDIVLGSKSCDDMGSFLFIEYITGVTNRFPIDRNDSLNLVGNHLDPRDKTALERFGVNKSEKPTNFIVRWDSIEA